MCNKTNKKSDLFSRVTSIKNSEVLLKKYFLRAKGRMKKHFIMQLSCQTHILWGVLHFLWWKVYLNKLSSRQWVCAFAQQHTPRSFVGQGDPKGRVLSTFLIGYYPITHTLQCLGTTKHFLPSLPTWIMKHIKYSSHYNQPLSWLRVAKCNWTYFWHRIPGYIYVGRV